MHTSHRGAPSKRRRGTGRRAWLAVAIMGIAGCTPTRADTQTQSGHHVGEMLLDDARYLVNNVQLDVEDIATAPLHVADENSVFRSPKFYLVFAGVGAVWGASFALDQTLRTHFRGMSSSDADLLAGISYASIAAGSAATYGYGLVGDDDVVRQSVLTGAEDAGIATGFDEGAIKPAFGRLRPYQDITATRRSSAAARPSSPAT